MKVYRGTFAGYSGAIRPPFILSGVILGSARVWHGKVLNQWATDWVQYWGTKAGGKGEGKGRHKGGDKDMDKDMDKDTDKDTDKEADKSASGDPFLLSDTSDQAIAAALTALGKMGRIDFSRVMVERGAWAYSVPPPNQAKDKSLADDFPGLGLAAATTFLAGRTVFHEITGHWSRYADQAP